MLPSAWRPCSYMQRRGISYLSRQLAQLSPKATVPQVSARDSHDSTLCAPRPTTALWAAAPLNVILNAQRNLYCLKCSPYCLLQVTRPWHLGSTEATNWICVLFSVQENTGRSTFLIGNIFWSAYCLNWSTAEAEGSVDLFRTQSVLQRPCTSVTQSPCEVWNAGWW